MASWSTSASTASRSIPPGSRSSGKRLAKSQPKSKACAWRHAWATRSTSTSRCAPRSGVSAREFGVALAPRGDGVAGQVGFQAVEVGVRAGDEAFGVGHAQAAVREGQDGVVAVWRELVADDAVADDCLVPGVFE